MRATAPARRTAAVIRNDGNDNAMFGAAPRPSRPAQLSRNVNSLGALWDEWLIGLNGNKPAKDFTSRERGANRHKYSKRLHVWRCISRHVGAGLSAEVAIAMLLPVIKKGISIYMYRFGC